MARTLDKSTRFRMLLMQMELNPVTANKSIFAIKRNKKLRFIENLRIITNAT